MKRRFYLIILFAIVTFSSMAQTIGDAFYIYRNDGQFNAFFRDEVISIDYSYEDADGNTYDEIVTQIVNTADSVYMIPLAAIDSVSFVTPETKYKPGVTLIDGELRQYVISSDEMQIVFSSQIPTNLLPRIGDKLVTLEQSDVFPSGFLGEVSSMEKNAEGNYLVCCDLANITDVFKCYYGISSSYSSERYPVSTFRRASDGGYLLWTPDPFRIALTDDWNAAVDLHDNFAYVYNPNFVFELTPSLRIRGFFIVRDEIDDDYYISLTVDADIHMTERIGGSGSLQWSKDWGLVDPVTGRPRLSTPIPQCPLITAYFEPGLFIRAASKISSQLEFTQDYKLVFHYDVSALYGSQMRPIIRLIPVAASYTGQVSMKGSIALGGYAEIGFLIADKRFAHLCFRYEAGWELESNAVLMNGDLAEANTSTRVYDWLSANSLNFNWFYGSKIEGRIWPFTVSYNLPLARREKINSLGHVPNFSNVSLESSDFGSLDAEAEIRGNLLNPVSVGFALVDEEGHRVDTYFAETQYHDHPSLLQHTFTGVEGGHKYTVYPLVRYNGIEMLASPSSDAELKAFPVNLSGFKQVNSRYKENAYSYDNNNYSYRFQCALTAELTDNENVVDWGFVYETSEGMEGYVSLRQYSSPCTDINWLCYTNNPNTTVSIYGYVTYRGESEDHYGEEEEYQLTYQEEDFPVKITKIQQTNSHHSEDAYSDHGRTYSYKFDCAVTVEMSESEGVEDWGYVYDNPDGEREHISLRSSGSPTTSYCPVYRNESSSTARFYAYVKYWDENEYYYSESEDYQLSHKEREFPVKITKFEQTGSKYEKDGFSNDGKTYSYKYDCAVTVELSSRDNVEDWGYVYEDPNGKTRKISLSSYGTSYTDNRYSYYRNESSSTVRLYEYVKYDDDSDYYYGKPTDYNVSHKSEGTITCPDGNHPHWIDLGLPSGTKWRCCNEGASTPEGFGGYYNFDQAQAYNPPSRDQINELLVNTTYVWTTLNGVNGGKFTGRNGGSIFLPAAGGFWLSEFYYVGSGGGYWSSTPDGESNAGGLRFFSGDASWHYGGRRSNELSVRPVR